MKDISFFPIVFKEPYFWLQRDKNQTNSYSFVSTILILYKIHILHITGDYFPSRNIVHLGKSYRDIEMRILPPLHFFQQSTMCYLTSLMVWVKLLCSSSSVKAMMGNYWDVP